MKYTFDVTTHENEYVIKVEVSNGSSYNNVSQTLTFLNNEDDNPSIDTLLSDMIDNIRLTVKERKEAQFNCEVFKNYLKSFSNKKNDQMIVENGDPSVTNIYEL